MISDFTGTSSCFYLSIINFSRRIFNNLTDIKRKSLVGHNLLVNINPNFDVYFYQWVTISNTIIHPTRKKENQQNFHTKYLLTRSRTWYSSLIAENNSIKAEHIAWHKSISYIINPFTVTLKFTHQINQFLVWSNSIMRRIYTIE